MSGKALFHHGVFALLCLMPEPSKLMGCFWLPMSVLLVLLCVPRASIICPPILQMPRFRTGLLHSLLFSSIL